MNYISHPSELKSFSNSVNYLQLVAFRGQMPPQTVKVISNNRRSSATQKTKLISVVIEFNLRVSICARRLGGGEVEAAL